MRKLLLALFGILATGPALAVCPLCTATMAGGLYLARQYGIDDMMTGLWVGAFILSISMWIAVKMKRRNIQNPWMYVLALVFPYAFILSIIFLTPGFHQWGNTIIGIDKLVVGVVTGSVLFWLTKLWYFRTKRNNGGHALFPFQKIVVPLVVLGLATFVYWLITR
ncbi:MAG: hypothetical protein FWD33_01775 [Alphaproteobacteria bacterium]|nr:hypothetical protein [Alphaproteobacteria bacterium]